MLTPAGLFYLCFHLDLILPVQISLKFFGDLKFINLQNSFNNEFSFKFSEGCQRGLFIRANLALMKLF